MPLSDANVVQENSGTTASGTSHAVTLPSGTTAGNTLLIAVYTLSGQVTPPSDITLAKAQSVITQVFTKSDVAAGETSWTFTTVGSTPTVWYVTELSNVDLVLPVDATAGATSGAIGNGGTASTGTTSLNAGLSTVAFAVFGVNLNGASWSDYTNGFEEVADLSSGITGTLGVARLFENSTTRTFESTATLTTGGSGLVANSVMVVLRAADSPVVAPLAHFVGMEWGTNGGTGASGATAPFGGPLAPSGTWNTNWLVQAGSARNSNYGLRVVQSAAAAHVRIGYLNGASGTKAATLGFNVRVVSATGTVSVAEIADQAASVRYAQLLYDSSATKFGVRCGTTGTVSWQSGTTALNTWVWIDWRMKITTTTWHAEWRIETAANTYTDQAPADLTGQSASSFIYIMSAGANTSQTMTADFDDVCLSTYYVAYPLGPHEVRLLTVDPAGTPTVSGTTTNFSTFSANGTLAAWNATTARNAVDEVPPTISAAADGVAQTATAAGDYIEFPMDTYACTATEFVNGVRMLAPLWSGTGAGAGDLAIRGYDGTTETVLATASQITPGAPTAVSSTVPVWRCAMWQSTNGWTQAELNAAALRVGFSGDATPDMGVEAIYLEAAIGKTRTQPLFGDFATIEEDPTRLGVVSVTTTAPDAGGDSSLYYETSGAPTTVPVPDATTVTAQLNAPDQPTTNYIGWYPPPEGVADA